MARADTPRGARRKGDATGPEGAGAGTPRGSAERRREGRLPAGRHGLTRAQVTNSQRKRLVDAMAYVAATKGYPATTVGDVVARAGVSRATFYQLFRDKEDCFVATMEEGLRMLTAAILPVVYATPEEWGWADRVRATMEALLEFIASEPEHAQAAVVEALAAGEPAFERYTAGTRLIISLLDQGREHAPTASLPSGTARAILGGAEWMIRGEMMAGRTRRVPELLPDFLYLALVPYLGQEEALRHARAAAARD